MPFNIKKFKLLNYQKFSINKKTYKITNNMEIKQEWIRDPRVIMFTEANFKNHHKIAKCEK